MDCILVIFNVNDYDGVLYLASSVHEKMDQVMQYVEPAKQFAKDSIRLIKRCTKPDRKEFQKIAMATAIGFAIMGFIGFFVKLIHIPINNIIVYVLFFSWRDFLNFFNKYIKEFTVWNIRVGAFIFHFKKNLNFINI